MGVLPLTSAVCILSRWLTTRYCEEPVEPWLPTEKRASLADDPNCTMSMSKVGAVPSARPTSAMGGRGGITKLESMAGEC